RGVVIGISRPLRRVVTGVTVIITTVTNLTGERSGDRHQLTSQQSSHRSHGHHNYRHGSDRRGGSDNHRSSNNTTLAVTTASHSRLPPRVHLCLAQLDIQRGVVTFYDNDEMYDPEWRKWRTMLVDGYKSVTRMPLPHELTDHLHLFQSMHGRVVNSVFYIFVTTHGTPPDQIQPVQYQQSVYIFRYETHLGRWLPSIWYPYPPIVGRHSYRQVSTDRLTLAPLPLDYY
nr:hypothetical protein [Tanacetum cinerariifolium]